MSQTLYKKTIGRGVDIALLHGFCFHSGVFENIAKELAKNYRVTVVDLPGFGQSAAFIGQWNMEDIVTSVLEAVPSNAIWIGWSLGGLIALWAAYYYPKQISKIILVASTPRFIEDITWPGITLKHFEQFTHSLCKNYHKTMFRFLSLQFYGLHQKSAFKSVKILLEKSIPSMDATVFALKLLKQMDLRIHLSKISTTLFMILGEYDILVPLSLAQNIYPLKSNAQIMIMKNAGHMPFFSDERTFLTLLNLILKP